MMMKNVASILAFVKQILSPPFVDNLPKLLKQFFNVLLLSDVFYLPKNMDRGPFLIRVEQPISTNLI
jgi:hypothetical protein